MKAHLREAGHPQTAFIEAWADVWPQASLRAETSRSRPSKSRLPVPGGAQPGASPTFPVCESALATQQPKPENHRIPIDPGTA